MRAHEAKDEEADARCGLARCGLDRGPFRLRTETMEEEFDGAPPAVAARGWELLRLAAAGRWQLGE